MAEYHDHGLTREELYANEKRRVNQEYDRKQEKKSWFTSRSSIEADRKVALDRVETSYFGERRGGGFAME